jgi:RNA polymerase sigma-70 factor (ECF subfamily)
MTETAGTHARAAEFAAARPQLFAVAYRMLGTVADAEDVLQDAYLRWQSADRTSVESAPAYLTTIVTRLCLDLLGSARRRRESYVGPWLPEPLLTDTSADPADVAELADSLSMAFLVLLESLTPLERAAFLLREVFGYGYDEVGRMLQRDEAACRQLVSRARRHVSARRPRFAASPDDGERLTTEFLIACGTGDVDGLVALLADDVVLWSDGGGVVSAARRPVFGADRVARFMVGIAQMEPGPLDVDLTWVNAAPGAVFRTAGVPIAVLALDVAADGRIAGVHIVRNPEKLAHLAR